MTPRHPCDHFEPGANLARCSKCGWAKGKHRARKQPKCATTGLFRYATPEAARVALNRLLGKPNGPMDTMRQLAPRPCPHCHGVHLRLEGDDNIATSRPRFEGRT